MSRARTGAHRPNQHERAQRRAAVEHLLARALRGALTVPEAAVLADYWRREQRAADATRKSLHDTTQALERHRAAADTAIRELEQRAAQAEAERDSIDLEAGAAHIQLAAALSRPRDTPREDLAAIAAEWRQRAEQAEDLLRIANETSNEAEQQRAAAEQRAEQAAVRLARIRDMADAWTRRLPETIRTATAAEAVRNAANGDDRPVMFAMTAMTAERTPVPGVAVIHDRQAEQRAEEAEQRLAAQHEMHEERRRALADALAADDQTPWPQLVDLAGQRNADARANGEDCRAEYERARRLEAELAAANEQRLAAEQRHRAAEQALDRVRRANTLGAAVAAVAEHDGMTPQAAAVHAAFTNAADSARARLEEQQRAHEVELAHSERRAASWASTAHRYAASLDAARAEADRFRAAWQSARTRAQVATRRAERRLGVLERHRAHLRALEDQAREAVEEAAQQRARANGWREHAIETDDRADRHLAAWRSARRRAAARTEERDRALALAAARGEALAAHLATTEATA